MGGGSSKQPLDKAAALQKTPFYVFLGDAELAALAGAFRRVKFSKGAELPESVFYLIVEGEIGVHAGDRELCARHGPAFFSRNVGRRPMKQKRRSSAADSYDSDKEAPRIVGKSPGSALIISSRDLEAFNAKSEAGARAAKVMLASSLETSLSKVPFVAAAELSDAQLHALAESCSFEAVDAGGTVFKQGATADAFYIVLHGKVEVVVDVVQMAADKKAVVAPGSKQEESVVRIETMRPGAYFGEMALVIDDVRSASVNALERSLFLRISRADFTSLLALAPSLDASVRLHCMERLLKRFQRIRLPIFSELTDEKVGEAARVAELVQLPPGATICAQGEEGKAFHVIVSGQVVVSTAAAAAEDGASSAPAETEQAVLHAGNYFGEVALAQEEGTPCLATCRVGPSSRCSLLVLQRAAFSSLFLGEANLWAEINLKLLQHNAQLIHALSHVQGRAKITEMLKKEFADEHLAFYDEVTAYQQLPLDPPLLEGAQDRAAMAKRLCDEFVRDGAERQVNIPDKVRRECLRALEAGGDALGAIFDAAKQEVYLLMARDTFRRFKETEPWRALLAELGSYGAPHGQMDSLTSKLRNLAPSTFAMSVGTA